MDDPLDNPRIIRCIKIVGTVFHKFIEIGIFNLIYKAISISMKKFYVFIKFNTFDKSNTACPM
jgi:hypothetical protein